MTSSFSTASSPLRFRHLDRQSFCMAEIVVPCRCNLWNLRKFASVNLPAFRCLPSALVRTAPSTVFPRGVGTSPLSFSGISAAPVFNARRDGRLYMMTVASIAEDRLCSECCGSSRSNICRKFPRFTIPPPDMKKLLLAQPAFMSIHLTLTLTRLVFLWNSGLCAYDANACPRTPLKP